MACNLSGRGPEVNSHFETNEKKRALVGANSIKIRRMNHLARFYRPALFTVMAAALFTQFNNCGEYSQSSDQTNSVWDLTCDTPACFNPTTENLEVKVNLGGGAEYAVSQSLMEINLGGDCNEGGFASNVITWELYLNGTKVRDSNMLGMAGQSPVNSRCINGRFLLYMNLGAIANDPVNRTGLNTGLGGRGQYDLFVEVIGQDLNGPPQRNPLKGRSHITLVPVI